MEIKKVAYENFRNIAEAEVAFTPGTNVLWGNNAQGKTNILEGIYFFARGKSFRASSDRETVRFGEQCARAELTFRRAASARETVLEAYIPASGKKKLLRSGAPLSGVSEMIGDFTAVLFCPEHLSLVSGSPAGRRSFLDIASAQLSGVYVGELRRFMRALDQRNALIRSCRQGGVYVSDAEWEALAAVMAPSAAYIAGARREYVGRLSGFVAEHFERMTSGNEIPEISYKTQVLPDEDEGAAAVSEMAARIERLLCENTEREIAAGTTLYGVHRDDLVIKLNGREAKSYASQGQTRSLSLAMKLAEGEIAGESGGEYPVFLLDDVLSELDSERRTYILGALRDRQIIVTSCEPELYSGRETANLIRVDNGRILL